MSTVYDPMAQLHQAARILMRPLTYTKVDFVLQSKAAPGVWASDVVDEHR